MRFISLFFTILTLFLSISCKKKPVEEVISTYPNGNPRVVKYYLIDDLKQKIYVKETDYYPGNIRKVEGGLKDGLKSGKWCYWYLNGNKWSEGNFICGLSHGKFSIWRENGSRFLISSYKFGKPDGLWIFWDNSGKINKEVRIKNNKKLKEIFF